MVAGIGWSLHVRYSVSCEGSTLCFASREPADSIQSSTTAAASKAAEA